MRATSAVVVLAWIAAISACDPNRGAAPPMAAASAKASSAETTRPKTDRSGATPATNVEPQALGPTQVAPSEPALEPAGVTTAGVCTCMELELFRGRRVKWEGECKAGKAHGKGVLRAYPSAESAGSTVLIFFGEIIHGEPSIGVIDVPDGFIAGELREGRVIDTGDRNTIIRAFRVASEAAMLASERFAAAGNRASARFYASKAEVLAEQMD